MLGITDDSVTASAKAKSRNPHKRNRHVTFNDEEIIINPEDVDPTIGRFRNLVKSTVVIPAGLGGSKRRFDGGIIGATPSTTATLLHQDFARPAVPPMSAAAAAAAATASSSGAYLPHHLYEDLPPSAHEHGQHNAHHMHAGASSAAAAAHLAGAGRHIGPGSGGLNAKFGLMLPNPAPEVTPVDSDEMATAGNEMSPSAEHADTSELDGKRICLWVFCGRQFLNRCTLYQSLPTDIDDDNSDEPRKKKYAKEAWPGRKPLLSTF